MPHFDHCSRLQRWRISREVRCSSSASAASPACVRLGREWVDFLRVAMDLQHGSCLNFLHFFLLSLLIRRIVMDFTTTKNISIITFIHWAALRTDNIRNRGAFTKELGHLQQQNRDDLIQWVQQKFNVPASGGTFSWTSSMNFPVPVLQSTFQFFNLPGVKNIDQETRVDSERHNCSAAVIGSPLETQKESRFELETYLSQKSIKKSHEIPWSFVVWLHGRICLSVTPCQGSRKPLRCASCLESQRRIRMGWFGWENIEETMGESIGNHGFPMIVPWNQ